MPRPLATATTVVSFCAVLAFAQNDRAGLEGKITDPSGGVIVHAPLTMRDEATGVERSTRTNEAGEYEFGGLNPASYRLIVSAPGFATVTRHAVLLRVGQRARLDLTVLPGPQEQSLVVTSDAALLQIDNSSVSSDLDQRSVQDLPNNGRQLQNLAQLIPGVSGGWNRSTLANRYGKARENTEGAFTVNGARSRSNYFLLDGAPINLRQYNVINFEPSNDAVQEFQVITSLPPAEYGGGTGGVVNIITRSGANDLHGSLYEFFRNDVLDANDTFNNRAGLARSAVRQNQFGGTVSGPVVRNRLFFFLNSEVGKNIQSATTRLTSVPTADERNGFVSYFDTAGRSQTLNLSGRIAPLSRRLLGFYPQPNTQGTGDLNFSTPVPIAITDYQYNQRTDFHITDHDLVTLRTSWNLNDQVYIVNFFGGPYLPGFSLPNPEQTTNGTVAYFHTFSPTVFNEVRLGVNRYKNPLGNGDNSSGAAIGLPNGDSANGIPSIAFNSGPLESLGGASFYNRLQNELTVFLGDSASVLVGTHHIRFGGELQNLQFNTRGATNERGTVFFNGSRNGIIPSGGVNARSAALADFLLGLPNQATITTGDFGRGYRGWTYAFFVQDNWRVTNRLTVDYGLRYDHSTPFTEKHDRLSNFLPGRGLVSASSRTLDDLYEPSRLNFAPRLGLAYDVTGSGRTLLRAGFGLRFDTNLQTSAVQQVENNAPFSAQAVTFAPTPFSNDDSPSLTLLNLRSTAQPSNSLVAIPARLPNPEVVQTSLGIQQALPFGLVGEVGYLYTHGFFLPVNANINQVPLDRLTSSQRASIAAAVKSGATTTAVLNTLRPFPGFDSIALFSNTANSTYHALQLKVERRLRHGLALLGSYSWSKSIDNATDFASGDPSEQVLDSLSLRRQRGPSSFDIAHRFVGSFSYDLPAPRWRGAFLTKGWQWNGTLTFQTGQPFTPFTSSFDPYRNESFNRLNVVGDPRRNVPAGFAYNPAAFAEPTPGTFGNSGRNIIRGGAFRSVDLGVFRTFAIRERLDAQLRFEATNALNQVNYQGPNTNQASSPGQFVSAAPPRQIQMGARVRF